ncbi:MAG: ATP-dependent protease ATPase subunit HslU [Acidobacteria bacterium]|nr:MAG: ATP-dependent protease ATPase subunit HslU [Acidobacteriota bacterium]REK01417.1 MAG: ATP-dependent protease ATPase subunit HslU [Acidobacteriota bacterium]REK14373.1 MAG: ATP-dependent protease ATPase subunit HslU [Acidobacteriota bacterium]REK45088.1 MAG: ATP-dependent protease ATPase subunit HslU [Acidobacteriota bacterium]
MAIMLGGETKQAPAERMLDELSPREIVEELDKYVVGQAAAKRAVAIALRNRIRRQKLPPDLARDVLPKNILMIGSTGVGKTEIARRLARLADSPLIKIEASKFTEVGYVGRDVESMVRELTDVAVDMTKQKAFEDVRTRAEENVEEIILDALLPTSGYGEEPDFEADNRIDFIDSKPNLGRTREKLRQQLRDGKLEDRVIEIETQDRSGGMIDFVGGQGMDDMGVNIKDMFGNIFPSKTVRRRVKISEARSYLIREEQENLVDMEQITREAIHRTETSGIIFLDELDKIAGGGSSGGNPDVSREGVQRDLLPIVEGTTVNTRYGMVSTEHILFIAAGAFHVAKPSDLIPELQGRFPIRVELESLTLEDFKRILIQPKNSLIKQYQALLKTEGIELEFKEDAISTLAEMTEEINRNTEDIGARRLHTLLEKVLEEISFQGSELPDKHQVIDGNYIKERLEGLVEDQDLRRYIL